MKRHEVTARAHDSQDRTLSSCSEKRNLVDTTQPMKGKLRDEGREQREHRKRIDTERCGSAAGVSLNDAARANSFRELRLPLAELADFQMLVARSIIACPDAAALAIAR